MKKKNMLDQHDNAPLYMKVARDIRHRLGREFRVGMTLPPEAKLAQELRVSIRTVREAMLVLEAHALIQRRHGTHTLVRRSGQLPVGLYCELDLLHPNTPRFNPLVVGLMRTLLAEHGLSTRLYSGRSHVGDEGGNMTCPELIEDTQAGRLSAVFAWVSRKHCRALEDMAMGGLPVMVPRDICEVSEYVDVAVQYLVDCGRKNLAMIAWEDPNSQKQNGGPTNQAFIAALNKRGLSYQPHWLRNHLNYGVRSAGWEVFREIWTASRQKPDGLVVLDENYLPDVATAVAEMRIAVPEQLTLIARTTKHVSWKMPLTFARLEFDSDLYAKAACQQLLHVMGMGEPYINNPWPAHKLITPDMVEQQMNMDASISSVHSKS